MGFSGCLLRKFKKKVAKLVTKIVKLDNAIAAFVPKWKKTISIGTVTLPPPIPAILHRALKIAKANHPPISRRVAGKTFLWLHTPGVFTPHRKYG